MSRLLCFIGIHDFHWPEHTVYPWQLWTDEHIDCWRGCGARTIKRCDHDEHWTQRHDERFTEAQR